MKQPVKKGEWDRYRGVGYALLAANGASVLLFILRASVTQTDRYYFLLLNLCLAWIPVIFAWLLQKNLQKQRWLSPGNILLTLLWLGFLPNSFYLISDLIHLQNTAEIGLLYDSVLFMSCIFNATVAGFISLYIIHKQLLKRLYSTKVTSIMAGVIMLCSFAIYLGRSLRWNTWDVLFNPFGLLFDVSDRIIDPVAHPQTFATTFTFFLLIASTYAVVYQFIRLLRKS